MYNFIFAVSMSSASVPVVKSTAAATAQSRSEEKETSPQQLPPDESGWNDDEWEVSLGLIRARV